MTGFGEARFETEARSCSVEVRSINSRHLKVVSKLPDSHASLESQVEKVVRDRLVRGAVSVTIRLHGGLEGAAGQIQRSALDAYRAQIADVTDTSHPALIAALLSLPGVVEVGDTAFNVEGDWQFIESTLVRALEQCDQMRRNEGKAMARELADSAQTILRILDVVCERAPQVVTNYRDRLRERVAGLIADTSAPVQAPDLAREVAVFADRCDISEEIARLRSHLDQFQASLRSDESTGRKLDFLVQEMFREANTIGAKANDASIAQQVVEIKAAIERAREIIQNIL